MKMQSYIAGILLGVFTLAGSVNTYAGNPDRTGSAGADQLLINPWARASGLANSSMASVKGIESTFLNVAGLAFVRKTEINFTNTNYLVGSDISLNSLGFAQRLGESSVLGISVMYMSFGDIAITTEDLPEGGIGTFSPNFANIGISYAKEFSNSIYGGVTIRVISEAISNVRSQGVSFDAGIRYVTGERDNLRFGIALRNVGPPMRYGGDGLTVTGSIPGTLFSNLTLESRSEKFELPSMVNIGAAYDFLLGEKHELTANLMFTSNSFTRDQFSVGAEYTFNERFVLRGGYQWEDGITNDEERINVFTGPAAGVSVQIPTGANNTIIGLDYSYRATSPFDGVHSIGAHIDL
jgi:hypothetical protein